MIWLPLKADEFAAQVLEQMQDAKGVGLSHLRRLAGAGAAATELRDVATLARSPVQASDFLLGQEPVWGDLQAGRAIERDSDGDLWSKAQAILRRTDTKGFLLITGTAGSGKSTALMRLCLRLSAAGVKVGWADRDSEMTPRDIRRAMRRDDAPPVLAIDDADVYSAELSALVRDIVTGDRKPLVIVGVRSNRVERVVNPTRLEGIPGVEVSVPGLTDRDIGNLLDLLDRENRLGALKGKPRAEQVQVFRTKADRQLLVAMIEATSNKRFEEKAVDELLGLETDSQHLYALIAFASSHRVNLTRDELLIASGDHSNVTLNNLDHLVRRGLAVDVGGDGGLRTRHRVIAEIIRDELLKRGQLQDVAQGLALLAATKVRPGLPRNARPWRLLRVVINHDFLERALGREGARNLYGSIEQVLAWEYHYWLQRGSLEVEFGDLSLAENFLNQARGLAGGNEPLIDNEWAYLVFKQALAEPTRADAPKLVNEATAILDDLIAKRGKSDSYPYHVLGSQGLAWSRYGISSPVEKARYLSKLIQRTKEGVARHPNAADLRQLADDLQRDYLSLAVRGTS